MDAARLDPGRVRVSGLQPWRGTISGMREMTDDDLARIRRAVQFRDRCREAAVAAGERLGIPLSGVQANVAFDAMVDLIREDERNRFT